MALPAPLLTGLQPNEIEYLATSQVHLNIVPLVRIDRVRLLSGVYGPFRPPRQARVPLWLALNLKAKRRCTVVPPDWLTVASLRELVAHESANLGFAPVPLHYIVVAKTLLDVASDDIPQTDEVRALLKALREARQSKVMSGLGALNPVHISMPNIAASEIGELRAFFTHAFDHMRALAPTSNASSSSFVGNDAEALANGLGGNRGDASMDAHYLDAAAAAPRRRGFALGDESQTSHEDGGVGGGAAAERDGYARGESLWRESYGSYGVHNGGGGVADGVGMDGDEEEMQVARWATSTTRRATAATAVPQPPPGAVATTGTTTELAAHTAGDTSMGAAASDSGYWSGGAGGVQRPRQGAPEGKGDARDDGDGSGFGAPGPYGRRGGGGGAGGFGGNGQGTGSSSMDLF